MSEVVLRDIEDGVATLTFNRPDRLNAWTAEMQTLYFDLLGFGPTGSQVAIDDVSILTGVDIIPPTVAIGQPSATITVGGTVTYSITYADSNFQASNLAAANVHLVHTGTASGTLGFDSSTGTSRVVTISGISGDGTLGIAIDAGSASDTAAADWSAFGIGTWMSLRKRINWARRS